MLADFLTSPLPESEHEALSLYVSQVAVRGRARDTVRRLLNLIKAATARFELDVNNFSFLIALRSIPPNLLDSSVDGAFNAIVTTCFPNMTLRDFLGDTLILFHEFASRLDDYAHQLQYEDLALAEWKLLVLGEMIDSLRCEDASDCCCDPPCFFTLDI